MTQSQPSRRERARQIKQLLGESGDNIKAGTQGFNAARYEATESLEGYEELKSQARSIKEAAIAELPELIETIQTAVEANGGTVYVADSSVDAVDYISTVANENEAETAVKSKSMTTEEIDLNEHLSEVDVDVFETDLGEFVIQVANEAPSHLVAPAIHRSSESIATLFNDHFELDEPLETPRELTVFARDYLGEKIRQADIGITGANFLLADSGSLVIITNEGNARKCAAVPDTHIAVAGIEKIIPSIDQLQPFVELIARSATGQPISRYVTMLSPPVDTPTVDFENRDTPLASADTDREFHLVLLDNGRSEMRDDDVLREVLYCIRCSACLNSCANFQSVGGHAFGGETYTGGIGTGWEAGVESLVSAGSFNDLCTGCTRCVNQCPVKIDIPWINTAIRHRVAEADEPPPLDFVYEGLLPTDESTNPSLRERAFANFDRLARWGSATAPLSNWLARRPVTRRGLDRFLGIDRRRPLPSFTRQTLVDRVGRRTSMDEDTEVILYADIYTNYSYVDRGLAAIEAIESLGYEVAVLPIHGVGREPYSQGMIEGARDRLTSFATAVAEPLQSDIPIVFVEPSDLAMVRRDGERLLDSNQHERLAAGCLDLFEFLAEIGHDRIETAFESGADIDVFYHSHCQQRTLELQSPTIEVLDRLGYTVTPSAVECCGMAGSFGYKSEYYDLSMDVGEDLSAQIEGASPDYVLASGISCMEQLGSLTDRSVNHPVEPLVQ